MSFDGVTLRFPHYANLGFSTEQLLTAYPAAALGQAARPARRVACREPRDASDEPFDSALGLAQDGVPSGVEGRRGPTPLGPAQWVDHGVRRSHHLLRARRGGLSPWDESRVAAGRIGGWEARNAVRADI